VEQEKRRYRHWGQQEDSVIASMFPEYSDLEIAARLDVGAASIRARRRLMGLHRREARGGHESAYPDNWEADAQRGSRLLLDALRAMQ